MAMAASIGIQSGASILRRIAAQNAEPEAQAVCAEIVDILPALAAVAAHNRSAQPCSGETAGDFVIRTGKCRRCHRFDNRGGLVAETAGRSGSVIFVRTITTMLHL